MKNRKIDNLLKQKIQSDKQIPDTVDSLFSNFKNKIDIKEPIKSSNNIRTFLKYSVAIATISLLCLGGGCTYAHIHGYETPISSLLRKLGINNKYEEHAISINESTISENIEITLLDAAIDSTSLIVGYQINSKEFNLDNWIELSGTYKLNNLSIHPISSTIDKDKNGSFILYQLFDMNEIDLKNAETATLDITILQISEYSEYEDLSSSYTDYNKIIEGTWNFNKDLFIHNVTPSQEYKLPNENIKIFNNVTISTNSLITGSYTNILKLQTNKQNYQGDNFDIYYKIKDESENEVVIGSEEKQYDYTIYNDRLVLGNISIDQKIKIEIYAKKISEENFKKVYEWNIDLSQKKKIDIMTSYTEFKGNEYKFSYDKNWKNLGIATSDSVGPYSRYLDSLQFEIPPTSNSEEISRLSIITKTNSSSAPEYLNKIRNEYLNSQELVYMVKEEMLCKIGSLDGYYILFETTDGDSTYQEAIYIVEKDKKVYEINLFATDIEYNNLRKDIDTLIDTFTILD